MPASNVVEQAAALVESARDTLPDAVRPELDELLRRLREPVRIAIVGRVSSGKSTMVNALLGQRIAPTDVSECTRQVTWFRYGHPQRLEIELVDGSRREMQLAADGTMPAELGVPAEQVRGLHCYLANDLLRWMTLVDTPGIGSVHAEFSATTEQLLAAENRSSAATQRADAVIFLFNQAVMMDEMELLRTIRKTAEGGPFQSAANALGILSKADQLGDGTQDPWGVAVELADQFAGKFRNEVAAVIPFIGLVAETAETATLSEHDANSISTMSELDEKTLQRMLWSADRFVSADVPVPAELRERLLELLDLYGLKRTIEAVRSGSVGAAALCAELSKLSGIAKVNRYLRTLFSEQDHVLKVRSVMDALVGISYRDDAGTPAQLLDLRARIEQLRLDPVMQPVAELEMLHECHSGRISLSPDLQQEVERLFAPGSHAAKLGTTGNDPAAQVEDIRQRMRRWRSFMVTEADPGQAQVARVVMRSYQLMMKEIG